MERKHFKSEIYLENYEPVEAQEVDIFLNAPIKFEYSIDDVEIKGKTQSGNPEPLNKSNSPNPDTECERGDGEKARMFLNASMKLQHPADEREIKRNIHLVELILESGLPEPDLEFERQAAQEEEIFLNTPIKIEYSADDYEIKGNARCDEFVLPNQPTIPLNLPGQSRRKDFSRFEQAHESRQQNLSKWLPIPRSRRKDLRRLDQVSESSGQDLSSLGPAPQSSRQDLSSLGPAPQSSRQDLSSLGPAPQSSQQDINRLEPVPKQLFNKLETGPKSHVLTLDGKFDLDNAKKDTIFRNVPFKLEHLLDDLEIQSPGKSESLTLSSLLGLVDDSAKTSEKQLNRTCNSQQNVAVATSSASDNMRSCDHTVSAREIVDCARMDGREQWNFIAASNHLMDDHGHGFRSSASTRLGVDHGSANCQLLRDAEKNITENGVLSNCQTAGTHFSSNNKVGGGTVIIHKKKKKPYQSNVCQQKLSRNDGFKSHQYQRADKRTYQCDLCEKTFVQLCYLKYHLSADHLGIKSYQCDLCKKKFLNNRGLWYHLRTHTEKAFECEQCGRKFHIKSELTFHAKIHSAEKEHFKCGVCGKQLMNKRNLTMHLKTHTGERPFLCDKCSRTFVTNYKLKKHYSIHTGERRYECDICKKKFMTKCYMSLHMRTHSIEKPFACDKCDKTFKLPANLYSHQQVHSDCKPHQCNLCERKFSHRNSLKRHHQRMHTEVSSLKDVEAL